MESIGTFQVESGKLAVTDPCYDREVWTRFPGERAFLGGVIDKVKNGEWEAFITMEKAGMWGDRVSNLVIIHESVDHMDYDEQDIYEIADFEVGVDSGQAGFFDETSYPQDPRGEGGEYNKDAFYDECCHATVGEDSRSKNAKGTHAGIIQGRGCVSSSGYGDGGYACFVKRNTQGELIAARIEYIGPEEDEEDDEDLETDDEADEVEENG